MNVKITNLLQLPKDWAWTRVGEIGDILAGYGFPKKLQGKTTGDLPFFKVADISNAFLRGDILLRCAMNYISAQVCKEIHATPLREGTIVFAKIGEAIKLNRRAILAQDSLVDNNVAGIHFSAGINNLFAFYVLLTLKLGEYSRATTVPSVRKSDLEYIPFPLPPISEQQRIVAKIEELFTRLDAGVEALKQIKAQLKRYRQSVLKHAFEGKLTEDWRQAHKHELEPASILLQRIREERKKEPKRKYKEFSPLDTSNMPELPDGWVWTRLLDVSEVVTGKTPSKTKIEYYGRVFCFYKPADLNSGYHVRESEDGLSRKGVVKSRLLPPKSTLVTCIGATIGKTGFIRKEGASNQQINAIIPENQLTPELIYFVCVSPQFQKSIIDNASSTTLPILNKSRFEILPIPLMSILEQKEIVSEIERRFSVADEIEEAVDHSLKQAERLRQSILKRAFAGKLVPQDPNEEPAEKLLERIKEERAKRLAEDHSRKKNRTRVTTKQTRLV